MGRTKGEMGRRRLTVLAIVFGLVFAISAPALAEQLRKETDRFTDSFEGTIPAGEVCEFPVGIDEEIKVSDTAWFDADDNVVKAHISVNGTTIWSGPGGSAIEHWSWSGWFDPVTMTSSQAGNVWNVHQNGLVVHDKALIVFDDTTSEAIRVSGPHEVYFDGLGALCAAIG